VALSFPKLLFGKNTKTSPQSMRDSSSLELAETSMDKNLQNKSSNGLDNSANGFRTSKNP
jgi:hypothetical protein